VQGESFFLLHVDKAARWGQPDQERIIALYGANFKLEAERNALHLLADILPI
jgi:hypothetical protein